MSGATTVYELKHPIVQVYSGAHGATREETISTVEIRRPTGKDLLLMDEYQDRPMRLTLEMISALRGLTSAQVQKLDAEDIGPLGELVMASVGDGPATGATA